MTKTKLITGVVLIAICLCSATFLSSNYNIIKKENPDSRNHNVCKKLLGNTLVYVVWAENKQSYPWTDYDIVSTVDSLNIAMKWLEKQAKLNNIKLNIIFDYYQNDSLKSIYQNMTGIVLDKLVAKEDAIERINKWGDKVVTKAFGLETKERLIAKLRDKNNVESVVLIFMLNNYFKKDYAFSFNTRSNKDVEFSIISSKSPIIISQEILRLFGAPYLFDHPSLANKKDKKQLEEMFPDDIMSNSQKSINDLQIQDITKYYIGWTDSLSNDFMKLVKDEKTKL